MALGRREQLCIDSPLTTSVRDTSGLKNDRGRAIFQIFYYSWSTAVGTDIIMFKSVC